LSEPSSFKDQVMDTANDMAEAGMFWRGNLATAVRKKDFKGTILGVLALSLLLFVYVWEHMEAVKLSYEVETLKVEQKQLQNQYYYLQYKLHDVDSLARVEVIAQSQLGMTVPKSDQVVILTDDDSIHSKWFLFWSSLMKKWGGR
jgi:cell division protein FtsL